MALVNNAETIGKGTKNLVLETAGHIYVKVNERYYELDFRNSGEKLVGKSIVETVQTPEEIDLSEYITNDDLKKALKKYVTAKSWEDVIDTQTALQNSLLDFEEAIKPITVQTMQVVVGTEELQFDWIKSFTNPDINVDPPLYIDENPSSNHYGQLVWKPGYIKHYTIDGPDKVQPDSDGKITYNRTKEYWRWYITNSEGLDEIEEVPLSDTFYVYLKVPYSKEYTMGNRNTNGGGLNGANVYIAADGTLGTMTAHGNMAKTGVGKVVYSDTAIKFGPETENGITYYYLLYAIVTNSDGSPSISTLNGFTEILPGQIRAYIFASPDGESYLNLMHSKLKLRDKLNFDGNNLYIKGAIVQDTGGNSQAATLYRDTWNSEYTYCPGNIVIRKDGDNVVGSYRFTGILPKGETVDTVPEYERLCGTAGDPLSDTDHWVCISKGSTSIVTAGLYYLDSDDDFTAIPTDENGIIQSTIAPWTIHLKMYEGSSPIGITNVVWSIPEAISNTVSIENKGNGDIKISVASGQKIEGTHKISFTATGATSDTSNPTVERSFLYTISGIQNADPNTMYFLRPSTNQIKDGDKSGISCQVFKNSPNGSELLSTWGNDIEVTYSIDGGAETIYEHGTTIKQSISSKIVFTLTVNNIVYDKETILVVKDGTNGTSVVAVKDYYYASESSSSNIPAVDDPAWTENEIPENYGLDNPYLWNYEKTIGSDGKPINTTPITLLCYYGKDGNNGLGIVWKGNLATAPSNPQTNWCYRDTDNGKVYIYNGSAWELMVLDGSNGEPGAKGDDGLSVFITYHDNAITSMPDTPTENGTTNGWHTNATKAANWMSQKVAASASEGAWGAPIQICGADGQNGIDGINGEDGVSIIWKGEFALHPNNPENGWAYKNTTDKKSYIYQDGSWYQMTIDGIDGAGISDIRDYYITTQDTTTPEAVLNNETYIPYNGNTPWKRSPTDVTHNADNPYIWKVEVILFDEDKGKTPICTSPVIIGVFTVNGIDAALLTLTTSSYIFSYEGLADIPTNEEIILNAYTQNVTPKTYKWEYTNSKKNGAYELIPGDNSKNSSYTLNYKSDIFGGTDSVTIRVSIQDPNNEGNWLFDEVTIFKIYAVSGLTLTCYLDNPCFDIPVKKGKYDFTKAFSNLHVVVDGEEIYNSFTIVDGKRKYENFTVTAGDTDVIYDYDEITKISKIYIDNKTTKSPGRYSVPITITYNSKYISTLNLDFEIDNDGYVELTYSNSAFVWDDINQSYTPDSISITANSYDINNAKYTGSYTWQYLNSDGEWANIGIGPTLEISANSSYFNGNRTATIKCYDSTLNDDYDTATFFLIKDGASNYLLDLSNESASVPADANGNIQSINSLHCKATLFYGSSKPSGVTYTLTVPEGVSGVSINETTGEFIFENSFTFSGDVASLVVEAKIGDVVKGTATMNISKIKPGNNGDPATVYWLIPSANQIVIDKDGNLSPSTISVSGFQQTGNGKVVAAEGVSYKWGYNTSTPESNYTEEIHIDSAQSFITFAMYKKENQKDVLIDSETVPILKDGEDGTPAFTVFLTNPTHIFPATEEGVVASTDRVGVMVYEGNVLYNRTQYFVTVADPRGLIQATTYENDDPTNYMKIGDTQINVIDFYMHECSKEDYLNDSRKKVITVYKGSVENQGEVLAVLEYNWSISWSGEPGAKGDDGPITRVRKFQSTADENTILVYNDGTYTETDGKKYLDFVFYQTDNNYYQCIKYQTITGSNEAIAPSDTTCWSLINNFKPIATSVLLVGANAEGWIIDEGIIKHTSGNISLTKNGEISAGTGKFSVSKTGDLKAPSGKIGNWEITTTGLVGKDIETESTTETGEDVSGTQYGGGGHNSKHYSIITRCKEVSIDKDRNSKRGYSEARIGSNVLPVGTSGTATGYFYNSLPKGVWTTKTDIVNYEWHDDKYRDSEFKEWQFNDFITSPPFLNLPLGLQTQIRERCSTIGEVCAHHGGDILGYGFICETTSETDPSWDPAIDTEQKTYTAYHIYVYDFHKSTNQWVSLSTNYGIISDVSNAEINYSFYSPNGSAIWKNGGCVSWSPDYRGFAYSNVIKKYLNKTNYFVFTGADSPGSGVWLPNKDDLTNMGAINKIFEITILVTVTSNKVYIISDDEYGKLLDNNDNIIKQSTFISAGGKRYNNYIEMTKGDKLTLLFDGQKWHKKVHSS